MTDGPKPMSLTSLNEGLVSTARIILFGLVMATIYQLKVFDRFYSIARIARRWSSPGAAGSTAS